MTCRIVKDGNNYTQINAPNGNPSKLFQDLLNHYGDPERALQEYAKVHSTEFNTAFGNWVKRAETDKHLQTIEDRALAESIDSNYKRAMKKSYDFSVDLKSYLLTGIPKVWKPFPDDDSVLAGKMMGDVFVVKHFAPSSMKSGVKLIKAALDADFPIALALPAGVGKQVEKVGFDTAAEIPEVFAGKVIKKNLYINKVVDKEREEKLISRYTDKSPYNYTPIQHDLTEVRKNVAANALINSLEKLGFKYGKLPKAWKDDNAMVKLALKVLEVDPKDAKDVIRKSIRPLTNILLSKEENEGLLDEIQKSNIFDYYASGGRLVSVKEWNNYSNSYIAKLALDRYIEDVLDGKSVPAAKSLGQRIVDMLLELFGVIRENALKQNLDRIVDQIKVGDLDFDATIKEGYKMLDFQEAVDKNPLASEIISALGENKNLILTGSIAYSPTVSVYRDAENPIHDLDFLTSIENFESSVQFLEKKYPDAYPMYNMSEMKSFVIPPKDHKIANVVREKGPNSRIKSYNVVNDKGAKVGSFELTYLEDGTPKEIKKGVEGLFVDIMKEKEVRPNQMAMRHKFKDPNGKEAEVSLSHFAFGFAAKLRYARTKDFRDFFLLKNLDENFGVKYAADRERKYPNIKHDVISPFVDNNGEPQLLYKDGNDFYTDPTDAPEEATPYFIGENSGFEEKSPGKFTISNPATAYKLASVKRIRNKKQESFKEFNELAGVDNLSIKEVNINFEIGPDVNIITFQNNEGKYVGYLSYDNTDGFLSALMGTELVKNQRGKGLGKEMYKLAGEYINSKGLTLKSDVDGSRSESASNVWKSLVKEGKAFYDKDHYEFISSVKNSVRNNEDSVKNIDQENLSEISYASYFGDLHMREAASLKYSVTSRRNEYTDGLKNPSMEGILNILKISDNPSNKILAIHLERLLKNDMPSVRVMTRQQFKDEGIYPDLGATTDFFYVTGANMIGVVEDFPHIETDFEKGILHEALHAASAIMLDGESPESNKFKRFYGAAKKKIQASSLEVDPYWLSDEHEFLVAVFTEPGFAEVLKSIPPIRPKRGKNLWQDFLNALRELLGAPNTDSLLQEAIDESVEILETYNEVPKSERDVIRAIEYDEMPDSEQKQLNKRMKKAIKDKQTVSELANLGKRTKQREERLCDGSCNILTSRFEEQGIPHSAISFKRKSPMGLFTETVDMAVVSLDGEPFLIDAIDIKKDRDKDTIDQVKSLRSTKFKPSVDILNSLVYGFGMELENVLTDEKKMTLHGEIDPVIVIDKVTTIPGVFGFDKTEIEASLISNPETKLKWLDGSAFETLEVKEGDEWVSPFDSKGTFDARPIPATEENFKKLGASDTDAVALAELFDSMGGKVGMAASVSPPDTEDPEAYTEEQMEITNKINETQKLFKENTTKINNKDLPEGLKDIQDLSEEEALERYELVDGTIIWGRITDAQTRIYRKGKDIEALRAQDTSNRSRISREMGTALHEVNELILKKLIESDGKTVPAKPKWLDRAHYNKLVKSMNKLYKQVYAIQSEINAKNGYNKKPYFLLEKKLLDLDKKIGKNLKGAAGTADIVVIFSDGTASIYDHKFINFKMKYDKKTKKREYTDTEIADKKEISYDMQISEYKRILTELYGVKKFRQSRILPVNVQYKSTKVGNDYVMKKELDFLETSDSMTEQIPVAREKTGDDGLDQLLSQLHNIRDDIRKRLSKNWDNEVLKARLSRTRKAIKALQLRKDITSVIDDSNTYVAKILERLRTGSIDENGKPNDSYITDAEMVEINDTLKLYDFLVKQSSDTLSEMRENDANKAQELEDLLIIQKGSLEHLRGELELAVKERVKDNAKGYGVNPKEIELAQRPMGFAEGSYRYLSEINHPVFRTFKKMVDKMIGDVNRQYDEFEAELRKVTSDLEAFGNSQGKTGVDVYDFIMNEKGNLKRKYNDQYWEEYNKAKADKNYTWAQDNLTWDDEQEDRFRKFKKEKRASIDKAYSDLPKGQRDAIYEQWLSRNDIKYNDGKSDAWFNGYAVPKDPEKYLTDEFKYIMNNKPLKAYYEFVVSFNKKAKEMSKDVKIRPGSFVPWVQKSTLDALGESGLGAIFGPKEFKQRLMNSLEVREEDTTFGMVDPVTGERKPTVPLLFVSPIISPEGEVDITQKSRDLSRSLMLFGESLFMHKYAKDLESMSLMMKEAIAHQSTVVMSKGMFAKPERDEGGDVIVREGDKSAVETFEKFVDFYIYGRKMQSKDKTFEVGEGDDKKTYSGIKLISKAISYFSKKSLAFNVISASASAIGSTSNAYSTGNKGLYYSNKDLRETHMMEVGRNPKHLGASEYFRVSQDDLNHERADKMSVSKIVKAMAVDKYYILQRKEADFIDRTITSAMMKNYAIDPESGKIDRITRLKRAYPDVEFKSLWDATEIVDDKIVVSQPDGTPITSDQYDSFRLKVREVVSKLKGTTTKEDISLYQTTILGKVLGHFKGWIPKMADERFKDPRYNYTLEELELGRYRVFFGEVIHKGFLPTLGRFMGDLTTFGYIGYKPDVERARAKYEQFLDEYPEHNPKNPDATEPVEFDQYLEQIESQMRAMSAEIRMYLMMLGAWIGIATDWDDDDKNNSWLKNQTQLLFNRARMELGFFFNPKEAISLIRSPVALSGLLIDVQKLATNTVSESIDLALGLDQSKQWSFTKGITRDQTPIFSYTTKMIPVAKGVGQFMDLFQDEESLLDYLNFTNQIKQ